MPIPPCRPPKFDKSSDALLTEAEELVSGRLKLVDQLVANKEYTFANTILPFIEHELDMIRRQRIIRFYSTTHPNADIRSAARKAASTILSPSDIELFSRRDFCHAVQTVKEQETVADPEYTLYLEHLVERFEGNGASLEDPQKLAEFVELKKRLVETERLISRTNDDSKAGVWFTAEELTGVPIDFIEGHVKENGQGDSNIWVSFKESDLSPVNKFAEREASRKKLYDAVQTEVPENVQRYSQVWSIRDKLAKLLGYENHAEFRVRRQAMGSPKRVLDFLDRVSGAMRALQEKDLKTMIELKKIDLSQHSQTPIAPPDKIAVWEKAYYLRAAKEQAMEFDEKPVNEYFTFDNTVKELLRMHSHIFNVKFVEETPREHEVMHESVKLYSLWEANDVFIGWLYIDPFPREGKYGHTAHHGIQPVSLSHF
jgi:metallopeptidase MepB